MRIGHGYDVHKLAEGRKLILGGVHIYHNKGLLGHSDADVLTHAIMDSLLGSLALGDIGQLFPDTDPRYKGADSIALLTHLERLELSRNPLDSLPAAMASMTELKELVLWDTRVTWLPDEFEELDGSLQVLDLRSCRLLLDEQKAIERLLPSVKKLWDYACNCSD